MSTHKICLLLRNMDNIFLNTPHMFLFLSELGPKIYVCVSGLSSEKTKYGRSALSFYFIEILHGSKVSRESDLRSVPYNRPVFIRSIVKNVKSLSGNQHNSLNHTR